MGFLENRNWDLLMPIVSPTHPEEAGSTPSICIVHFNGLKMEKLRFFK